MCELRILGIAEATEAESFEIECASLGLGERIVPLQLLLANRSDRSLYYYSYGKQWEAGSRPRLSIFRLAGGRRFLDYSDGCLSGLRRLTLQAGEELLFRILLEPQTDPLVLQIKVEDENAFIQYAEAEWNGS